MPTNDKYNGWTNRETWAVHLWISSHEDLYYSCLNQSDIFIQDFITQLLGDGTGGDERLALMLRDIGSLWRVNWDEVARALIGDGK